MVTLNQFPGTEKYILTFTDVSKIEQEKEHFREQASTDALTGLFNRKRFDELLAIELQRAARYQMPLSLIIFDIDHFKKINDTLGHQAGDTVLEKLAGLISESIREVDILARWGGEEFMLLTPNCDMDSACLLAERLRLMIERFDFKNVGSVTCSFGIAEFRPDENAADLLKRADQTLYRAKELGRNRISKEDS
jgi:diguanylate cyclase (GGDEF)-like protein